MSQRQKLPLMMKQQLKKQSKMYIFGLGNPGSKYEGTRHNVGFLTIEKIAALEKVKLRKRCFSLYRWAHLASGDTLVQPLTYMNNSGSIIPSLIHDGDKLIVIVDQMDLPPGRIRIRKNGGSAGHNGLKSIISYFGEDFIRVYVGVGRPLDGTSVVDHVLARFSEEDMILIDKATDAAASAVIDILNGERIELVIQRANSFQA